MADNSLEADLRELAENITECSVGLWWNMDKGCGCPMSQLAISKDIVTEEELESTVHVQGDYTFLELRMLHHYPTKEDGLVMHRFPTEFDREFDGRMFAGHFVDWTDNHELIKEVMLTAIERAKIGRR
jgi:hypothetical protein